MPLLNLQVSIKIDEAKKNKLLSLMSRLLSKEMGKPEQYVMVSIFESSIIMSGSTDPSAFADIRSIGGTNSISNTNVSKCLCSLLEEELNIPKKNIYINFSDIKAENWGWNGGTF